MLKCLPFFPNETEITFDGGVAPLLEAFGKSLETLSLEYFDSAPISTIAEFCPNLTWLHINNVTGSLDNERDLGCIKEKVPMFKDLKFLFCHDDIQPDILLLLLSSPSLQHISISDCDTLSDEVLQKAAIKTWQKRKTGIQRSPERWPCWAVFLLLQDDLVTNRTEA
jgi:hypothetical protein